MMEAPSPSMKKIQQEKYEIKDNEGKIYNIDLSLTENNIYFEIDFKGDILNEKYFLSLDLNTLKNSCRTFNLMDKCSDAFDFIKDLFKMNKISIKIENSSLYLIMIVPVLLKEEEIKFHLNKQKNKQEDIINDLIQIVKELKNENLKLKTENIEINKRLDILENWKKEIEKIEKEKKEKIEKEKIEKEKFNSKIMTTNEQINLIKNKFINRGKAIQRLNLLFSSSKDGDSSQTVHNKIDGKKDILLFVETTKGRKFGGYTNIGFDSSNNHKNDDEAFLVSFDKLKIYDNINKGGWAIYCCNSNPPWFYSMAGKYNIRIDNKFFSNLGYTTKKGDCYQTTEDYELNGGEESFTVKELEYFQIVFN